MSIIEEMSSFAVNLNYDEIPENVVNLVKKATLDTIGVIASGVNESISKNIVEMILEEKSVSECSIFGYEEKVSCRNSALLNSIMAAFHDLDDVHEKATVHPGAVIIPTVISVGQKERVSGKNLIKAIVAGYEVLIRTSLASKKKCGFSGWNLTTICGVFGAAAATGVLIGLNKEEMTNALGIASTLAVGNMQSRSEGADAHILQFGMSTYNGILSSYLAKKGMTGPKLALEAPKSGFYLLHFQDYDETQVLENLGQIFEIEKVSIKPYSSNRSTHSAITAVIELIEVNDIDSEKIQEINIRVTSNAFNKININTIDGENIYMIKQSAPFAVSVALRNGSVDAKAYSSENLNNSTIKELMKKVNVIADSDMDNEFGNVSICPANVEIITKDGTVYSIKSLAKGSPAKPLSEEEVEEKFKLYSVPYIGKEKADKVIRMVWELDTLQDVCSLAELMG